MKDLKNLVIFLMSMAYSYIIVSFVLWEFDLSKMNDGNRFVMLVLSIVICFAFKLIKDLHDNN